MPTYQYRISRTLPNGWQTRLDILPPISNLNDPANTLVELDAVSLLELSSQKNEFDAVPYGMSKTQTLKIKLAWSRLPTDLKTWIQTTGTVRPTLFYFYTDRGTNGATWSLEFVGMEDNIEAFELEPLGDGQYAYSIELADFAYMVMKRTTDHVRNPYNLSTLVPATGYDPEWVPNNTPWQIYLTATRGRNQSGDLSGCKLYVTDAYKAMNRVCYNLGAILAQATGNYPEQPNVLWDTTNSLRNIFTASLTLYGCTTDGVDVGGKLRRKGSALASTDLKLTTHVNRVASGVETLIGGLFSSADNYAWNAKGASAYDLLRDLCETLGVKVSYRYSIVPANTQTDQPYDTIGLVWDVKRIGSSRDYANNVDTADVTLDMTKALTDAKITVRGENILKSEVRYETSNQEDKTEIVRIANGARASRSMNVEPIVHNIPVFYSDYDERRGRYGPFRQTNHVYFNGNGAGGSPDGSIMKVHEDTLYWYGPGANHYVSVTSTASDNPWDQREETQQQTGLQLAAMQAETSMAAALTKLHLKAFSDDNNALVEIEWPVTISSYVLPSGLCGRHNLTGGPADIFTNLSWTRALPVSVEVNWIEGKSQMSYYLLKPTTAN
jgi:hypothetical protein